MRFRSMFGFRKFAKKGSTVNRTGRKRLASHARHFALFLLTLTVLSGCSAAPLQLSPTAEAVKVTSSPDAGRGCESLGMIDSGLPSVSRRLVGEKEAGADAIRRLKLKADEKGANVVVLLGQGTETSGYGGNTYSYHRANGEAFRCPTP